MQSGSYLTQLGVVALTLRMMRCAIVLVARGFSLMQRATGSRRVGVRQRG
jgi:hypothetical protein